MNRIRVAIVAAAIPLVALAGAANAQDRYPPSPTDGPRDGVSVLPTDIVKTPDTAVLPTEEVNAPAADTAPLAATGADVALLGLSGLAALTAGGGAVYASRRRKD